MNHKKQMICAALCLLTIFGGTGCGTSQNTEESAAEDDAQTTASAESAETEPAETESAETEKPEPVYDYVHGDEGYFSLVDSGLGTPVKLQENGTCWVVSASTAMESGALVKHGKTIAVDALELLDAVYIQERTEGWFLAENLAGAGWSPRLLQTASAATS